MLTPPGATATGDVVLSKARRPRKRECSVEAGTFRLTWQKRTARIQVERAGLEEAGRVATALLDDIDRFREGLVRLESNGCLEPGEAGPLLDGIVDGLALPSRVLFYLRHGTSVHTGYVDLRPPFRMKVVAPLREQGQTLGFETAWYRMDGAGPVIEYVESFRQGKRTTTKTPAVAKVSLTQGARWYRLFFLTRRSASDHDILLLAAPTPKDLEERTARIRDNPETACREFGDFCFLVPAGMAISGELPVRAGGKLVYASITGTVGEVLKNAGAANARAIRVLRPHQGRLAEVTYDGVATDIRSLVLIGGEELSWQP